MRVAIIGGGLGGLAAALFLRDAGLDVVVYEQASRLSDAGAGIVIPPNMVRVLRRLGLDRRLPEFAVKLEAAWEFRRWQDGSILFAQPMGEECNRLYGGHCYVAHRADLRSLLCRDLPGDMLRLGHRCLSLRQVKDSVELELVTSAGEAVEAVADIVIGADGIHSLVRDAIAPEISARFSGLCAFRCLVPAADAPDIALRPVQTLWLGPGRHFVHYPVRSGALVNIVAIAPAGDWRIESWTAAGEVDDLAREFDGWDSRVHDLIAAATETSRWALFDRAPLDSWTKGRITLLGDAAHAMLPFFAQGAAQAIEDALALARCMRAVTKDSVESCLLRYEAIRRPRVNHVLMMSRGREVRNHLPDGPEQRQRDAELAVGEPLRQAAWLYGDAWEADLPG